MKELKDIISYPVKYDEKSKNIYDSKGVNIDKLVTIDEHMHLFGELFADAINSRISQECKSTFSLYHTSLYAKGWYKKTDIIEDLKKTLSADGYSGELFRKHDIMTVILNECTRINKPVFSELCIFIDGINESNCWKYGYYTTKHSWAVNEHQVEYDQNMAIILYCLSQLGNFTRGDIGIKNYPLPDPLCLPLSQNATEERIQSFFKEQVA